LRAFADGFGSSLLGGAVYCALLMCYRPAELTFAWPGVIVLSMTFGSFEMWRITPRRAPGKRAALVLWAVLASVFLLWAVRGVSIPGGEKAPYVPVDRKRLNRDAVAAVRGERWESIRQRFIVIRSSPRDVKDRRAG
jgi:hypothetical protein